MIDNENRVYFFWNYLGYNAQFNYRYIDSNGNWSDILNPFKGLNVTSFFYKGVMDDQNIMHVACAFKIFGQGTNYPCLNYFTNENNIWSSNIQLSDSDDYFIQIINGNRNTLVKIIKQ